MKLRPLLYSAFALVAALPSCSSPGTMSVSSYDGRTGQSTVKNYSKYYDEGVWISPQHLGMSVVVDHEKTVIPVVTSVQQSMGALGPSDTVANGKVTIYLWNLDQKAHAVKILHVSTNKGSITPGNAFQVEARGSRPLARSGGEVGDVPILNYGTEIPIKVEYEWNGKRSTAKLTLKRRTPEELHAYFGENRNHPYPWAR